MNKQITYNALLCLLGLLMASVVIINIGNGLHYDYHNLGDDVNVKLTYNNYGVLYGVGYLYKNCNGRLLSHMLAVCLVPWLVTNKLLLVGFYLINVFLFVFILSWFLRQLFIYRYSVSLTQYHACILACLFYSIFFFFFFAKRFEFWYWLSDVFIYEYSLMLILILTGILLKPAAGKVSAVLIVLLSLCIGLMSETQALAQLLISGFLLFEKGKSLHKTIKYGKWKIVSSGIIISALVINYLSPGTVHKISISKTHLENSGNYTRGFLIIVKDLALKWDSIIIGSYRPNQFHSFYVQIICGLLLFLFLKVFTTGWWGRQHIIHLNNKALGIVSVATVIFLFTYLIPAILYANVLDFVVERCKFIGCFFMFLAMFDALIILTGIYKRPEGE